MMRQRFEIASLLGYSSWADYNAAAKMTLNGKRIAEFIDAVDAAARPATEREYALLLAEKQKTDPSATQLYDYEVFYLTNQVKQSRYGFDSRLLRPYLPYAQTKQGLLDTTARLFHVNFRRELNVPVWEPSVETWDVLDGGNFIGRIYLDMYPCPGKDMGLTLPLLAGIRGRQLPEVFILFNFPQPTATDPALLEFDDVSLTLFHEFGHAMHTILSGRQRSGGTNYRNMELDFIEMPSQLFEKWPANPAVLASFAHHYKTGKPVPLGTR
jgi:thimet oligopeptidase